MTAEGILRIKFYDILVAGGVFTSFVTCILLFLFNRQKYQQNANRLLGIVIFSWGWYAFLYLLIVTGWLRFIPEIYRIGSPLYYLIPPCSYLYTRSVLFDETKLRKYDWLHFLPALLNVIDLLPYYMADAETKKTVADAIASNFNMSYRVGSGIIPAFWHFQMRWIQGIIYLVFQWIMIARVLQKEKLTEFRSVKGWLLSFTLFCTLLYVGLGAGPTH